MTILLLKLLALIATGVFAILGMWAEHRETKKLARSFPFWGVVLTTLLSGLLLFIETNKAAKDAIDTSVRLAKTAEQQQELLHNLTGGDSYCYLGLGRIDNDAMTWVVILQGDYPLRNVYINVKDRDTFDALNKLDGPALLDAMKRNTTTHDLPIVMPRIVRDLGTILNLKDATVKRFRIDIYTPHHKFAQELQLRKVNNEWKLAYKVMEENPIIKDGIKTPPKLLTTQSDPGFPVGANGEIQWN